MKKIFFLLTIVSAISFGKEVVPAPVRTAEVPATSRIVNLTRSESFALAFGMNTGKISAQQFVSQTPSGSTGGSVTTTPGATSVSVSSGGHGARMGVNPNFTPYGN